MIVQGSFGRAAHCLKKACIVVTNDAPAVFPRPGNDHIVAVRGNDQLDGGEGTDYCAPASVRISVEKPTGLP